MRNHTPQPSKLQIYALFSRCFGSLISSPAMCWQRLNTVTNPAIWLVLSAVRIFLISWSRQRRETARVKYLGSVMLVNFSESTGGNRPYMASSASGQDESNPVLWLATRAGKMELTRTLWTTRRVPQEKFPRKPYNKSFIGQVCSVKMAGYCLRSFFFLRVYGPRLRFGP